MEQDIKNLTEIIELSKEEIENNNENVTAILDLEDLKSLQNVLEKFTDIEEREKIDCLNKILDKCKENYMTLLLRKLQIDYQETLEDAINGKREIYILTRKVD